MEQKPGIVQENPIHSSALEKEREGLVALVRETRDRIDKRNTEYENLRALIESLPDDEDEEAEQVSATVPAAPRKRSGILKTAAVVAGLGAAGMAAAFSSKTEQRALAQEATPVEYRMSAEKATPISWERNLGSYAEYVDTGFSETLKGMESTAGFEHYLHRAERLEHGDFIGNCVMVKGKKCYFIDSENRLADSASVSVNVAGPEDGGVIVVKDSAEAERVLAGVGIELPERFKEYLEPISVIAPEEIGDDATTVTLPTELAIMPEKEVVGDSITVVSADARDTGASVAPLEHVSRKEYNNMVSVYDIGNRENSLSTFTLLRTTIVALESAGGDYHAVSPTGAVGAYQVIRSTWFPKIGLNPKSAEDRQLFLNSPTLQDRLFRVIYHHNFRKYESENDIKAFLSEYLLGDPRAYFAEDADTRGDINGSVRDYVDGIYGNYARLKKNPEKWKPLDWRFGSKKIAKVEKKKVSKKNEA